MRTLAVAFGLMVLPILILAQPGSDSVPIKIRHLTLVGVTQLSLTEQQQIADEIENLSPPGKTSVASVAEIGERLRYALQERGFFKALVADPDVTIVSSTASEKIIDATYQVDLGRQYRLKGITFSNVNPDKGLAFRLTELQQAFPIKEGEIFNTEKIRIGFEKLRKLYADSGYINFTPVPNTEVDDQSDTITLRVDLDEGLVFRAGILALDGVEPVPGGGARLLSSWKHYEGQIFNEQLLQDFMRENAALLPSQRMDWQLFEVRQDPVTHVVNIRLELDDLVEIK